MRIRGALGPGSIMSVVMIKDYIKGCAVWRVVDLPGHTFTSFKTQYTLQVDKIPVVSRNG